MKKKEKLTPLILKFSNDAAKNYNLDPEIAEKIYRVYWSAIFKEIGSFENEHVKVEGFGSFMTSLKKISKFKETYYEKILESELRSIQGVEITEFRAAKIDSIINKIDKLAKLAENIKERFKHQTTLREETRIKKGYKKPIKNNENQIFNNDNPFE